LASNRDALRQTRPKLPRCNLSRRSPLLDQIVSPDPTLAEFGIDLDLEALGVVRRLWPLNNSPIVWPPHRFLSLAGANRVGDILQEVMRAPFAEWRPLPPGF
jgi:hypothetical protein